MGGVSLTEEDRLALSGARGEAVGLAMKLLVDMADVSGASRLRDVSSAHVDGSLYHGRASLDFAERLVRGGGSVAVPTTLNVGSLDLLHPEIFRGDGEMGSSARRLMDAYVALGCRPTWTCAPYQLEDVRPALGEHVAWAESNAIVFANSVLGARTERYGDFIDICAGLTGRVPDAGLHLDEQRAGSVVFRLSGVPDHVLADDVLYPVLGHLVGRETGGEVPVIEGIPEGTSEDRLKSLGAAAASSGAVAMFHAVGVTPEAPDVDSALHGRTPKRTVEVTPERLRDARRELSTSLNGPLSAVSIGTPHASLEHLRELARLASGRVADGVEAYVSTGRDVLAAARSEGIEKRLTDVGWRIVTDTCTYVTPVLRNLRGTAMTDSAKWAYYAPGNLGVEVVFGSLEECVRSASNGRILLDGGWWGG